MFKRVFIRYKNENCQVTLSRTKLANLSWILGGHQGRPDRGAATVQSNYQGDVQLLDRAGQFGVTGGCRSVGRSRRINDIRLATTAIDDAVDCRSVSTLATVTQGAPDFTPRLGLIM